MAPSGLIRVGRTTRDRPPQFGRLVGFLNLGHCRLPGVPPLARQPGEYIYRSLDLNRWIIAGLKIGLYVDPSDTRMRPKKEKMSMGYRGQICARDGHRSCQRR